MKRSDKARQLGHREEIIALYEDLKQKTIIYNNDDISELDIIYFLGNILWSANFELVAKTIKQYGYESRLDQWKEALDELNNTPTEKVV